MFDISFGEILLIGVVALVVLGPERLPVVARTLGALVARAQRFVASVRSDIGQHADLVSLASLKQEVQQTAVAFHQKLSSEVAEVQQTIHQAKLDTTEELEVARLSDKVEFPRPVSTVNPEDLTSAESVVVNENQLELFTDTLAAPISREPRQ